MSPPLTQLRVLRLAAGLTQRELAARVRVSRDLISLLERGARPRNPTLPARLAAALGLPAAHWLWAPWVDVTVVGGRLVVRDAGGMVPQRVEPPAAAARRAR